MIAKISSKFSILLIVGLVPGVQSCSPKPQGIAVEMPFQGQASFNKDPNGNTQGENRCEILASPTQVAPGGNVQLSTLAHGDIKSLLVDNQTMNLPAGFLNVTPTATTEYRGIGLIEGGSQVVCSVTVTVIGGSTPPGGTPPVVTPPANLPTCTLTAGNTNINAGEATTLKIVAPADATNIILDGSAVQNNGQKFVTPPSTQTFTGTFTSPSGNNSCSATVTVNASGNPNGGVGGLPPIRESVKSCMVYTQSLSLNTCTVSCPKGWIMKDVATYPQPNTQKHGGRCDSAGGNGNQSIVCYGGNNSQFGGFRQEPSCLCKILCEGY